MIADLSVELIHATVQLEQPLGDGTRTVGTGFLISAPTPEGKPRTVLVTANHVLTRMPGQEMKIGWRVQEPDGEWKYRPTKVTIRSGSTPLWTKNPERDVAVMEIQAPAEFAKAAIPLDWLADGAAFDNYGVGPGYEMMALGFPRGLSANGAGFPILRSGKVASYPIAPSRRFPTFLLDFSVFPGNSGGPVFMTEGQGSAARLMIAGMLTQQVELDQERLEIGIVTQANFIRETVALLDRPQSPRPPATLAAPSLSPVASSPEAFSASSPAAMVSR
jgi:S1-C subfamily serine protease